MPDMLPHMSEYEKLRAKNIEENKKMLESLGLLRSFKPILEPIKKKRVVSTAVKKIPPAIKRKFEETKTKRASALEEVIGNRIRRSLRVKGFEPDGSALPESEPESEDTDFKPVTPKIRENVFGPIDGIPVGFHWETRMQCAADGIHRPTVAGIHGNVVLGCYSIALSGGYEDDIDLGESFTYTGSGGRDLKGTSQNPKNLRTASQSKDQTLTKSNLSLSLNVENRKPVRVIRGYKLQSAFAPEYGYRYDGLYSVEKYWSAVGMSGYLVWKYILKRLPGQEPPPWKEALYDIEENSEEMKAVSSEENKENIDEGKAIRSDEDKENLQEMKDTSFEDEKESLEEVKSVVRDEAAAKNEEKAAAQENDADISNESTDSDGEYIDLNSYKGD